MDKVAIIGSRTFPVIQAGPAIFEWLAATIHPDATIYTRGSRGFDEYLTEGARFMGWTVVEMKGSGGADNYLRDVSLVESVETVYAFFDADHVGEGGTQHVIDKALDQRKPNHAYIWDGRALRYIGGDDGEGDSPDLEASAASAPEAAREAAPERAEQGGIGSPVWPDGVADDLGF